VDWAGLLSVVLSVILVFSVIVGCFIGINVVVGIIVWRVVVSCSKPAWMLAFNTLKSMCCGGGVMDRGCGGRCVALVGAGVGVVGGCVVGIGCLRKAVSRIKPARMLAFNASFV